MPNTHSTLSSLFTAIANAIRSKTGSSAQIIADNFPTEISNIPTGIDPSDATAVAGDILASKTAYVSTGKVTGSMTNQGAWTGATSGSGNVTVPAGYHNGSGYVSGSGAYNAGRNQGKADRRTVYVYVQALGSTKVSIQIDDGSGTPFSTYTADIGGRLNGYLSYNGGLTRS